MNEGNPSSSGKTIGTKKSSALKGEAKRVKRMKTGILNGSCWVEAGARRD